MTLLNRTRVANALLLLWLTMCGLLMNSCYLRDYDYSQDYELGVHREYVHVPEIYKRHAGIYDGLIMTGHGDSAFVVADTVCVCKIELGNTDVKMLTVHDIPLKLFVNAIDGMYLETVENLGNNVFNTDIKTKYSLIAFFMYPTENIDKNYNGPIELCIDESTNNTFIIANSESGYKDNLIVSYVKKIAL